MSTVVVTALTAIAGALIGAGFAQLNSTGQKGNDAAKARWNELLDRRTSQLTDLLMPMKTKRSQASAYREQLPILEADDVTPWSLVHHAGTIAVAYRDMISEQPTGADPPFALNQTQLGIAHRIVEIGNEVCELIDSNAGLFDGPPPQPYLDYQQHHRGLELAWEQGIDQPPETSDPFDDSVIAQLEADIERVHDEHQALLQAGPETRGAGRGWMLAILGVALFAGVVVADFFEDSERQLLVTTADTAFCGVATTDAQGQLMVAGMAVPAGSAVEFVEFCN